MIHRLTLECEFTCFTVCLSYELHDSAFDSNCMNLHDSPFDSRMNLHDSPFDVLMNCVSGVIQVSGQ